ncbi:uncharacterized protein LOC131191674 [Ahaetulla prasina]|uniref:uncharacterized protein LOC131191674 n=1 Tax=Ahaetulla prasina TaxID=499056 RepID=UPI0026482579|nr:uncharacterized protein LOC131191674 [Ahaetulla prasina]
MERILEKLSNMDKKLDEIRAEIVTIQKDLKDTQQVSAENKQKVEGLEGEMRAVQKREETTGNAVLGLQMDKMSYFLRFQNLEEVDQEDLRDVVTKLLGEFLGRGVDFMNWDVDRVYRVNSQYARTHAVPREVHVKFVRRETRDEILRKHRSGALIYRGREIAILRQIPRQVREKRKKYYFLSSKLYQKGVGFRWLMPEGLMIFREGITKKISTIAEATAYVEEHKALLESDDPGIEEGEVIDHGAEAAAAVVALELGQAEPRVLRYKTRK